MNLQEAKNLKAGDILNPNTCHACDEIAIPNIPYMAYGMMNIVKVFPKGIYNSDGSLIRYTVTSVKTWKRNPEKIIVRAKRGLYEHIELNENTIKFLVKS